jgi:hypothetical protein
MDYSGPEALVVRVEPDGSGPAPTQAFVLGGGGMADATVEVQLLDILGVPVPNFPWQDVWMATVTGTGTITSCRSGTGGQLFPDPVNSDAQGWLIFSVPLRAGGHSEGLMQVFVSGQPLQSSAGLALLYVSPDINGDLRVDLQDTGYFSQDLFFAYHLRSDFNGDGTIDLTDAGFMIAAIGADCPE